MEKIIRKEIPFTSFRTQIFNLWAKDWLLLSAGDFAAGKYNMMTVGWGSIGVIWAKPFVMALVRPQRFTCPLMDNFPDFTLAAFPESCRSALNFCGTKSGRDYPDKASAAGLTAIASKLAAAPSYEEAELVIECRKTYLSQLNLDNFADPEAGKKLYPAGDLHKVYFGEIVRIEGSDKYRI